MDTKLIRTFQQADWPDMVRFYEQFYRKDYIFTQHQFFDWNFLSPLRCSEAYNQHLSLDGQKIAGIMGALPWPLRFGSQKVSGEYNINLFIDPAYRGQNLGQKLLESVSSGCQYSLTNGYEPKTLSIYQRLGSVYYWAMERYVKCLDSEKTAVLFKASPNFLKLPAEAKEAALEKISKSEHVFSYASSLKFEKVHRFATDWDLAWDRLSLNYGFTTDRTASFLNWRYIDYPFPIYECYVAKQNTEIVGLVVLRHEAAQAGKVSRIVDLVCDEEFLIDELCFAAKLSLEKGSMFVDFIAGGRVNSALLSDAGFFALQDQEGNTLLPMDFHPVRYRNAINTLMMFLDPKDQLRHYFDEKNFYITKGDGDQDRAN